MKRVFSLSSGLCVFLFWLTAGWAQSLKPGTEIRVRLIDRLDTGEARNGQLFSATLADPVSLGHKKILARGTRVRGQIIAAVSSGRLKRPASLTLVLTDIDKTSIQTEPLQIDGESHANRNAALIGGGAAIGSILGAVAGGETGAVLGTAIGAGAGTGTAYMTGKHEIVLPSEAQLTFVVAGSTGGAARVREPGAGSAVRQVPEPEPASWNGPAPGEESDALMFSDRDAWLIRSYFEANYGNLPPGLANRGGELPPGLEKRLRRDGTLPPGLQKRVEPFPDKLEQQLPGLPFGYSRVVLSGRAMILDQDGRIVDLMFIYR